MFLNVVYFLLALTEHVCSENKKADFKRMYSVTQKEDSHSS
jgi:hypothetical protein